MLNEAMMVDWYNVEILIDLVLKQRRRSDNGMNGVYRAEMKEAKVCELCVHSKQKRLISNDYVGNPTLISVNCGRLSSNEPVVLLKPFSYSEEKIINERERKSS